MNNYLITYDLHNRRQYTRLLSLMKQWSAVTLCESVWLVRLTGPASAIRDIVAGTLDGDDTVAVLQIPAGADWATLRVNARANNWLSAIVKKAA